MKLNICLCVPCVGPTARLDGPTAGREGSMEACGPTERQMVVRGKTAGTLTAAAASLTTDMPGKSIHLHTVLFKYIYIYTHIDGQMKLYEALFVQEKASGLLPKQAQWHVVACKT